MAVQGSKFLQLPGEIREAIYHEVLCSINNKHDAGDHYKKYAFDLALLRTCTQVHTEALAVFRRDNIFVSIETPWPEAQNHVAIDGYVPIVVAGDAAQRFDAVYMTVRIRPQARFAPLPEPLRRFIILIDDLPLFTEMWYYSDLTHQGMNPHLRLTLELKDPFQRDFEARPIPKAIQRKLIEPFGRVKGLNEVKIEGEHYGSIEKTMKDEMAVPYPTVEKCLDDATRLKDEGNDALRKKKYEDALRLYRESFLAIMIVCEGRRRSIWGDAYFQTQVRGGQYDGQIAQMVRMILRIRLVANTIMAYLQLKDYEMARFWGMRTIDLMRANMDLDTDEDLTGFPALPEMGKIFYRTAKALQALGDKAQARTNMRRAVKLLPNDATVRRDYDALANECQWGGRS